MLTGVFSNVARHLPSLGMNFLSYFVNIFWMAGGNNTSLSVFHATILYTPKWIWRLQPISWLVLLQNLRPIASIDHGIGYTVHINVLVCNVHVWDMLMTNTVCGCMKQPYMLDPKYKCHCNQLENLKARHPSCYGPILKQPIFQEVAR